MKWSLTTRIEAKVRTPANGSTGLDSDDERCSRLGREFRCRAGCDHRCRLGLPDDDPDPGFGGEGADDDCQRLEFDPQGRSARKRPAGSCRLQKALPVVNVFEEAAYWTTSMDGAGKNAQRRACVPPALPAGQLPPNDAFWSLTATDTVGYMVSNPTGRSSVDDHSGLVTNPDGSVDILLQPQPPSGQEQNWLPTPTGRFKLMLRAYLPGAAILDGGYEVPPVVKVA